MIDWWWHIPEHLDPIAFSIGLFPIRFYALFFLFGWVAAYGSARARMKREALPFPKDVLDDIFFWSLFGAIAGARLGYGILYDQALLLHPSSLIIPYDAAGAWVGISGMSYFGGAIGVIVAMGALSRKRGWNLLAVTDFLVPIVPIAIFFGRLGNFFNLELIGNVTTKPWGMLFPQDPSRTLRHPSTLYEALFEGIFLFVLFRVLRKKTYSPGMLSSFYLVAYGVVRFLLEPFRAFEGFTMHGLERWITIGQLFALFSIVVGAGLFLSLRMRKNGILGR